MKKWSPLNQIKKASPLNQTRYDTSYGDPGNINYAKSTNQDLSKVVSDYRTLKMEENHPAYNFARNYIDIDGDGNAEPWEYGLEVATWAPSIIAGIAGTATTGVGGVPAAAATKVGLKQGAKQIVKNVPKWWNKGKTLFNKYMRPWRTPGNRNVINTNYIPRYPEINLGGFKVGGGNIFPHHSVGMGRNPSFYNIPIRGETFYNPNAKYGLSTLGVMGLKSLFRPTEDKRDGVDPLIIDQQNQVRENTPNPFIIQDDKTQTILDGRRGGNLNISPQRNY